ncbi:hypothetical protein H5410_047084 [Solanum commersonii]|uniref:Uncharacterized protein n=1 Tax=Solanum commersonii TaxID=4109 RepID=A0A9J5XG64_SOLCO|nr:hypothetical protein H5410_047084 [Solanum commersonii]
MEAISTRKICARLGLLQTLTTQTIARKDNTLTLLTFNLNTRPPLLPIYSHVLGNAYLYPSVYPLYPATRTSSLRRLRTVSSHVQTISVSLVHHRCHSHLLPNNLIPNLIAPSVPTHPSQHPHLRNMHFLNMCVLDWLALRSIQQGRSNYHSVELTFKSRWNFLITQDSRGKPPFPPSSPNAITYDLLDPKTPTVPIVPESFRVRQITQHDVSIPFFIQKFVKISSPSLLDGGLFHQYSAFLILDTLHLVQVASLPLS